MNAFIRKDNLIQFTETEAKKILTSLVTLGLKEVSITYTDRKLEDCTYSLASIDKLIEYPRLLVVTTPGSGYIPEIRTIIFKLSKYQRGGEDVFF